ncbi:AsmA family protein [soil metagenome]
MTETPTSAAGEAPLPETQSVGAATAAPHDFTGWRVAPARAEESSATPSDATASPVETAGPGHGWRKTTYWIGGILGAILLLLIIFLALFDWDWVRKPAARFVGARIHREVSIDGHLRVHLLTFTPSVRVEGLRIGQPKGGPAGDMAQVQSITGEIKLLPLLAGRQEVPLLDIEKPNLVLRTDAQGRSNWDFSDPNNTKPNAPFKLPPIQHLVIADGHIDFRDEKRKITLTGTLNSNERIGESGKVANDRSAFGLRGKGLINGQTFLLAVTGGPLVNVRRDRPYPFDADIRAGATHLTAKGQVTHPFDLGRFEADLQLNGDDLNDVYHLTGLALPNSPPYRLSGHLVRNGKIYDLTRAAGRIGASDIEGRLQVDTTNKRAYLDADLTSKSLDWKDLGAIFGAPGVSSAATPQQKAELKAAAPAVAARLLPDAKLKIDQLRAMDADFTFRATSINAPGLPLQNLSLTGNLDEGVLKLNPLTVGFPQGALTGSVSLDGRKDTPITNLDMRLSNVRIEQFLPEQKGQKPVEGTLQARAKLIGAGDSIRKAAGASNGQVTAVIPGGQIRQAFAELLGIDATKGLFLLLNKDQHQTNIRCALADFRVVDGVLRAERITIDTGVVVVNGTGAISLKDESIDLKFNGKPTKFRLVRVLAPITVGGHLKSPSFGVQPGGAIVQAGIAVGLVAVLGPLAAILPFVDPGTAKNADCAALLADARSGPAATATKLAAPVSAAKVRAVKSR